MLLHKELNTRNISRFFEWWGKGLHGSTRIKDGVRIMFILIGGANMPHPMDIAAGHLARESMRNHINIAMQSCNRFLQCAWLFLDLQDIPVYFAVSYQNKTLHRIALHTVASHGIEQYLAAYNFIDCEATQCLACRQPISQHYSETLRWITCHNMAHHSITWHNIAE